MNAEDQRLHLIDPAGAVRPITPPSDDRHGDLRPLDATTLVCVRERPGGPDEAAGPDGFVAGLPVPVAFDEVQRVPDLLLAVKAEIDEHWS